jgi:hypothetical protein
VSERVAIFAVFLIFRELAAEDNISASIDAIPENSQQVWRDV